MKRDEKATNSGRTQSRQKWIDDIQKEIGKLDRQLKVLEEEKGRLMGELEKKRKALRALL